MIPAHVRIFVCTAPVDMRRGFDGLALAVRERLGQEPRAGGLFVFANRRANRCKILWFDRTGACLLYKRLHRALFRLPTGNGASGVRIEGAELATLLDGVPVPSRQNARAAPEGAPEGARIC
jgi:transposase